jgi:hypothetical protein
VEDGKSLTGLYCEAILVAPNVFEDERVSWLDNFAALCGEDVVEATLVNRRYLLFQGQTGKIEQFHWHDCSSVA